MDFSSFDHKVEGYEIISTPLNSLEINIPNQLDVMIDKTIDRVQKPKFFHTRGCPIRHLDRMDFNEEDSDIEEHILPLYAAHLGNNFDQIQEV